MAKDDRPYESHPFSIAAIHLWITIMEIIKGSNLGIRFLLELCALAALGNWGFHASGSTILRASLAIGTPFIAAVVWATIVAPQASVPAPAIVRFVVELAVFGSAIVALIATGRAQMAWVLAMMYLVNRTLMVAWEQ